MNSKYQPCLLCGSQNVTFTCAVSLQDKFACDITTCGECGLAFANPMLTPEQLQHLYDREYWDLRRAQRVFPRLYRVGKAYGRRLARESATGRMLEIGCGLSFFLRGVADCCEWEIEGLDAAEGIAEFAQTKLGLRVRQGMFAGDCFPPETYDLVRAKDVLEHVSDPLAFLQGIHRVLRPGGRVELWLPNGPIDLTPARRAARQGRVVRQDAGHVLFIPPRALRRLLQSAGFVVARAEVFSLRPALKMLGWLPDRQGLKYARPAGEGPGEAPVAARGEGNPLDQWERPPPEQGLKGTMLYARLREWRFHRPSVPAWLPIGLRQWAIGRKA